MVNVAKIGIGDVSMLKYRSKISNSIRTDLYEQLKKIHEETDIPISKLLDRAVELLIEEEKEWSKPKRRR